MCTHVAWMSGEIGAVQNVHLLLFSSCTFQSNESFSINARAYCVHLIDVYIFTL